MVLAIPCLSLLWDQFPNDGYLSLASLATIGMSFVLGSYFTRLDTIFRAAACGIGLNSLIAIAQWYRFEPVIQLCCRPSGLFLNGNILAETAALVLAGLLATRPDRCRNTLKTTALVCGLLLSLLLPMHRGSMIALAVAGMTWLMGSLSSARRFIVACSGMLLFMLLISVWWLNTMPAASGVIGLIPDWGNGLSALLSLLTLPASVSERFEIWSATISGFTWFGHGAGSFRGLFPLYASPVDTMLLWPQHTHNDLLELIFEYGVFAAIPVAIAILCLLSRSPMRYVVLVFLVEGCFEFPLFMPATGFLAALCVGHCLREWDRARFAQLFGRMDSFAWRGRARLGQAATGGVAVSV